jgi:hypothetical protein
LLRNKGLACLTLFAFFLSVGMGVMVAPKSALAAADAAKIEQLANQIAAVYKCLDDTDKAAIKAARDRATSMTRDEWKTIVNQTLLTPEVIARFGGTADDVVAAEDALIDFAKTLGLIYYPPNGDWKTQLETIANDPNVNDSFKKLMATNDPDTKINQLFDLVNDIRAEIPNVSKSYSSEFKKPNNELVKVVDDIAEGSIRNALNKPANAGIKNDLTDLQWTSVELTELLKKIAQTVDPNNEADMALLYGYIRSVTSLAYRDGTPLAESNGVYTLTKDKSIEVRALNTRIDNWVILEIVDKSNNQIVSWPKDNEGFYKVPSAGSYTITGYRDYTGATPQNDWLLKATVNVATGGGGGGGGGGTSPGTTVPAAQGGTVTSGNATLEIPANAIPSDVRIQIQRVTNTAGLTLAANEQLVSEVFEIVKDKSGNFTKPVTITLKFDPNKVDPNKYDLVICWYDSVNNKWVPLDNIQVDLAGNRVSGQVDHFTKFAVIAVEKAVVPTTDLTDIKGHWAFNEIVSLVDLKVLSGYPDKTFKPNNDISRAEFATVIVKALKLEAKAGKVFADTANHWAKDFIATANAYGIINGYSDSSFGPNDPITREQMAVMIANALKLSGSSTSISFTDANSISDWAKDAVAVVAEKGIITGYPDGSFKPDGKLTRAEAASVTVRALNNIQ